MQLKIFRRNDYGFIEEPLSEITPTQLANLKVLLDVVKSKVGQEIKVLNRFLSQCGTYGCVAGDYFLKKLNLEYIEVDNTGFPCDKEIDAKVNSVLFSKNEFGYRFANKRFVFKEDGSSEWKETIVFGGSKEGSIEDRIKVIEYLIEHSPVNEAVCA